MAGFAALNSFNAGELSPKLAGRSDVSQYSHGCRKLCNFIVTPYGSVERRPGLKFLAACNVSSGNVRLIPFIVSSTVAYICEFGGGYIRIYRNDGTLVSQLVSAYVADYLDEIKYIQSADVMTIVHPYNPVMELKRHDNGTFTLSAKEYEFPPVLDPNLDNDLTVTPSAATGDITLTASKDLFLSSNVGGFFELVHIRENNEISKDFTADGVSGSMEVFGYWTFTTHGTWTGNIIIQRSYDNGVTWEDFRTYSSSNDSNTSTSGTEDTRSVLYRLKMRDYEQAESGTLLLCRALFVNPDFTTTGVVKITAFTDAQHVSGTVTQKLGGTAATHEWNEGAWSARRGYPRSIAFYEERMMFGGTAYQPQTVWGSKTGDWDNYLTGDKDDDAVDFTLSSDTVNTICWMCQHDALIIGTMDSEWTLSSSSQDKALTPSNFKVRRQSVYGSCGIRACMVNDVLLFVQRGRRKVREFVYQWQKDGYTSPDMTVLAEHISLSGIVDTALSQLPDSILWCVLEDGTCAALTYERDQEVAGWHKHTTDGSFLSVCVIPDGDCDQVCFIVQRNGQYNIEIMQPRTFDSISDAFFVDGGVTAAGTGITRVTGLSHLNGKTVQILADGAVQAEKKVASGSVTLDASASKVTVGLGYESLLSPMPIELETQEGSSMLRSKLVGELRLRMYSSLGGEVRCNSGDWQDVISRDVLSDTMDDPLILKDDVSVIIPQGGFAKSSVIEVRQAEPLPLNVDSMVALFEVEKR